MRWVLYVDESGQLDGEQTSVVTGVLLPDDPEVEERLEEELEFAREATLKTLAHPPHQNILNIPAAWLAVWMLHPRHHHLEPHLRGRLDAIAERVLKEDAPATREFVQMIEEQRAHWKPKRRRVAYEPAKRLDVWMRGRLREEHGFLKSLAEQWSSELREVCRLTIANAGGTVVNSYELREFPEDREHYLRALEALIQRAVLLLGVRLGRATPARLRCVVAERRVEWKDQVRELDPALVEAVGCRVADALGRPVQIGPVEVVKYNHEVPGGVALADALANRARGLGDQLRWRAIKDTWHGASAVEAEWADAAGLPTFTATGEPSRAVRAWIQGRRHPMPSADWRWAAGQADVWRQFLSLGPGRLP